ncbi:uncharacterized protein LOC117123459 [Anneissia japonica]|uniref:uncharacterized protein LOC117123459 n=1 Tax=Anneissia japonica TaxID=1529436 RepID=UPI0014257868|nr:uncharacterized protein LOC117123459 [Anneissia japonica]
MASQIFAQRLLYRFSEHVFELDPPLKRTKYRLDRVKLMRWVRTHRAPLFFKTDLYLEYILCKHVLKTQLYQPCTHGVEYYGLKDKTLDRRLLNKCLNKVSGMRRFRTFLVGTAGERGYEFWIDAERFRKTAKDDKERSREIFREISAKYYKNGGVLELCDEWKPLPEMKNRQRDRSSDGVSCTELASESDDNSHSSILNAFTVVQGFILKSLQNYWVPRFLIRCKSTWVKNQKVDIDTVYQPDCCVIHVRSLSELNVESEEGKKHEDLPENIKLARSARKTHLKKQSVNNLLSMFTSSSIRRSELAAMLKLEDTGEITASTNVNKDQYEENEWNTGDGFPLPTISEENIEEIEPTPPPSEDESSQNLSDECLDDDTSDTAVKHIELDVTHKEERAPVLEIYQNRKPKSIDPTSDTVVKHVGNEVSMLFSEDRVPLLEISQSNKETHEDQESHVKSSETYDDTKVDVADKEDAEKKIDNEIFNQYHERFKKMAQRRRQSFAAPELIDNASSSSMRRLSSSGVSASLRRMSTGSFTSEKTEVTAPKAALVPKKKRYKPQKKHRAQSVEFRLGDFSMLMQSLTTNDSSVTTAEEPPDAANTGRRNKIKKPIVDPSLEDALKLGLPQLQADILALQKFKEDGSKKKKKLKKNGGESNETSTKGGRNSDYNTSGGRKKSSGRRGSVLEPLTKANLTRLEQLAAKSNRSTSSKNIRKGEKHKLPEISLNTSSSISTDSIKRTHENQPDLEDTVVCALPSLTSKSELSAFPRFSVTEPYYVNWNLRKIVSKNVKLSIIDTIFSDSLAGGPFENFLRRNGQQQNVNFLNFWQKSEEFLSTTVCRCDIRGRKVRYLIAMDIKTAYLATSSIKRIQLGNQLIQRLSEYLTLDSYVADELVRYVQGLVCEKLKEALLLFRKYDREDFLNRTTRKKADRFWMKRNEQETSVFSSSITSLQQPLQKDAIATKATDAISASSKTDDDNLGFSDSLAPRRMIKAFNLAKGFLQHTRNFEEDSMANLSDPDSESDDEGSLKPKKIKVIRKRKQEVKFIDEIGTMEYKGESQKEPIVRRVSIQRGLRSESRDMLKASQSTFKTIKKNGKNIQRPPQPKSFNEILRDSSQLEFFKRFLAREKSDTPLLFWQAVENMKSSCKDAKSRQIKTNQIVRKFFNKSTANGAALQCNAEIIEDIPYLDKVTPQMIMSAQVCVAKSIEENWFELYKDSFPDEEIVTSDDSAFTTRAMEPGQKTKALWGMFISNVVSFRRGLMNPLMLELFEKFVLKEVHKELEKQRQTGIQSKRVICNKVVIVERIQNDLRFFAEVERYKQLADSAAKAAAQGTYNIDDEEFVQLKARAIINSYIDSQVPPKLQINITQELADQIVDTANNGLIERGLFHEATLSIFAVILYCWKKFCRERCTPGRMHSHVSSSTTPEAVKTKIKRKKSPLKYKNGQYILKEVIGPSSKTIFNVSSRSSVSSICVMCRVKPGFLYGKPAHGLLILCTAVYILYLLLLLFRVPPVCPIILLFYNAILVDEPPRITFTLQHGLQLILPPKPKVEVNEKYRNMMRKLYKSSEFDSTNESMLLINAMQNTQGISPRIHRRLSQFSQSIRQHLQFAHQFMPVNST